HGDPPAAVTHQHALDERVVEQPPQRLAGGAAVALLVPDRGDQLWKQLAGERRPRRGREVGHRLRVGHLPAEVVPGQLVGPERPLAQRLDRGAATGAVEIREVTWGLRAARAGEGE